MKKLLLLAVFIVILSSFTKKQIEWMAIGDSITYLNDHPDETGNRITKGYMTRVTEKLADIHYTNIGRNGWTSGDIAKSIDSLQIQTAAIYSVFLGTNDWWTGRPIGKFSDYENNTGNTTIYGSFRIIINKLHKLNSTSKIILITPMQRSDFVYINDMKNNAYGSYKNKNGQSLEQVAEAIVSISKFEHIEVIDLYHAKGMAVKDMVKFKRLKDPSTGNYKNFTYPSFIDIPFNPEKDEYPYPLNAMDVSFDGLHPSDKGYAMIADMLVEKIK